MVEHYPFKLNSEFDPQGDQPQAIEKIVKGVRRRKASSNALEPLGQVRHLQ